MHKHDLAITWMVQALKGLHAEVRGHAQELEQTHDAETRKAAIAKAEAMQKLIASLRPLIKE